MKRYSLPQLEEIAQEDGAPYTVSRFLEYMGMRETADLLASRPRKKPRLPAWDQSDGIGMEHPDIDPDLHESD